MKLTISSFNCKNVKSSFEEIGELCSTGDVIWPLICFQETWLVEDELASLSSISKDHYVLGIPSMDSKKSIIMGRPFENLDILLFCGTILLVRFVYNYG